MDATTENPEEGEDLLEATDELYESVGWSIKDDSVAGSDPLLLLQLMVFLLRGVPRSL